MVYLEVEYISLLHRLPAALRRLRRRIMVFLVSLRLETTNASLLTRRVMQIVHGFNSAHCNQGSEPSVV